MTRVDAVINASCAGVKFGWVCHMRRTRSTKTGQWAAPSGDRRSYGSRMKLGISEAAGLSVSAGVAGMSG